MKLNIFMALLLFNTFTSCLAMKKGRNNDRKEEQHWFIPGVSQDQVDALWVGISNDISEFGEETRNFVSGTINTLWQGAQAIENSLASVVEPQEVTVYDAATMAKEKRKVEKKQSNKQNTKELKNNYRDQIQKLRSAQKTMLQNYQKRKEKELCNNEKVNTYIQAIGKKEATYSDLQALLLALKGEPVSPDTAEKAGHMIFIEKKIEELQKFSTPLDLQQLQ